MSRNLQIRAILKDAGLTYFYVNLLKTGGYIIGCTRAYSLEKLKRMQAALTAKKLTSSLLIDRQYLLLEEEEAAKLQKDEAARNHHVALRPKRTQIELHENERILAVVPEHCAGPGWSNTPLWVYIETQNGIGQRGLRTECIQPGEQNYEQFLLFKIGAQIHRQLLDSVTVKQIRKKE